MRYQSSIWERDVLEARYDIIIAGAGLAGLWCALELKKRKPQLKILIAERGAFGCGASSRNAGFACFGSPTELIHDRAVMGDDVMWQLVEMRFKGMAKIQKMFKAQVIGWDDCGGYECLNGASNEQVHQNLPWLNAGLADITGTTNCFEWANDKLTTLGLKGFDGLVQNRLEAALHSGNLLQALQKHVENTGVKIMFGLEIHKASTGGKLTATHHGGQIDLSCNHLVYCTNAFTNALIGDEVVTPGRGQVLVTTPIENLLLNGTFHFDEGYYYFRHIGNRVLLGGARNTALKQEETTEMYTTADIQQQLLNFLHSHVLLEGTFGIDYAWSGIMAFTKNKQPQIIQVNDNTTAVIGCNGMGVALLPILAEKLAKRF